MAVLVVLLLLGGFWRFSVQGTCDDGQYLIEKDLADAYECSRDHTLQLSAYSEPAGESRCTDEPLPPLLRCMEDNISYSEHPPSSGAYRPVAPRYGEYSYLPAQRWLHVLQLGGVAFLYHPCAPPTEVARLCSVARACLWKHVITPYPFLPAEKPFALVSWGCVYHMSWVNPPEAELWLKQHALQTELHMVSSSGAYRQGLILEASAADILPDVVCPSPLQTNPPPHPTDALCTNTSHTLCHDSATALQKHALVVLLLLLAGVVCAAAVFCLTWKLCNRLRNSNRTTSRYKSVSKFFPFSYGKVSESVALPELGLPKSGRAERQVLLNYSDEEEL